MKRTQVLIQKSRGQARRALRYVPTRPETKEKSPAARKADGDQQPKGSRVPLIFPRQRSRQDGAPFRRGVPTAVARASSGLLPSPFWMNVVLPGMYCSNANGTRHVRQCQRSIVKKQTGRFSARRLRYRFSTVTLFSVSLSSIASTTSCPSVTSPNTVCLPSRCDCGARVMKN